MDGMTKTTYPLTYFLYWGYNQSLFVLFCFLHLGSNVKLSFHSVFHYRYLFTKSSSFLLGSNWVKGWYKICRTISKVLARSNRRFMDIHGIWILKTWVPVMRIMTIVRILWKVVSLLSGHCHRRELKVKFPQLMQTPEREYLCVTCYFYFEVKHQVILTHYLKLSFSYIK